MSFRFRRSVRLIPGVRLNFSKSGVSASFGIRGAGVTLGKSGAHLNLGVPGTGFSYRTRLDRPAGQPPSETDRQSPYEANHEFGDALPELQPDSVVPDGLHYTGRREYRSAHPDTLSSPHLQQLADLVSEVEARRARIDEAVSECRSRIGEAERRLARGGSWFLRPFISRRRLNEIAAHLKELRSLADDLANVREGTVIDADFGLADEA